MGARLLTTPLYKKVASYTGPGDVVSGAKAWWGLRAYNAAYATGSNPAVDLVDQAGANAITINILSNGNLDVASINTWVTAHSVTTILVSKLYDQPNHGGSPIDVSQSNNTLRPKLLVSGGPSSLPILQGDATRYLQSATGFNWSAFAQPQTFSAVVEQVSFSAEAAWIGDSGFFIACAFKAANTVQAYAGVSGTATAADNSFHAVQMIMNGASSTIYVDGSSNTVNSGTQAIGSVNDSMFIFNDGAGRIFNGNCGEVGWWNAGFSGTQQSNMNSNQHTYWGF